MTGEIAFVFAVALALSFVATGVLERRRSARYSRLAHTECTRSKWAEAREELFNLVRDGKLEPRSQTFVVLYAIQGFIIRRPNAYPQIADQIQHFMLQPSRDGQPRWYEEQPSWPSEMQAILSKMAHGFDMLAFGYPGFLGKLLRFSITKAPSFVARACKRRIVHATGFRKRSEFMRVEKDLIEARDQLQRLSGKRHTGEFMLIPA